MCLGKGPNVCLQVGYFQVGQQLRGVAEFDGPEAYPEQKTRIQTRSDVQVGE